jgi:hypothetical protein
MNKNIINHTKEILSNTNQGEQILDINIINELCEQHLLTIIATSNELKLFLDILNILD